MKVLGRGRIKHQEIVESVTLTPEDVGVMGPGAVRQSVVAVVTNIGTRDPTGVPTIEISTPLVTAAFVPPNIVELTAAADLPLVDEAFVFEVDAP